METTMTRPSACALALLLTAASTLSAQTMGPESAPTKYTLFAGPSYFFRSYAHTQLNPVSGGMYGWNTTFSGTHAFSSHIGYRLDFSGHYRTGGFFSPQVYHVLAGPQFTSTWGRSSVDVHGLAGAILSSGQVIAQTKSDVRYAIGAGAGLDHPIGQRLAWRFSFDWIYGGFQTNDTNQISEIVNNNFRFSSGPVFRF
jgi:hypothetical protein